MPRFPKPESTARPDEAPASFADLKPPGYYSATLGYFVPVREISEAEFWERSFLPDAIAALERQSKH